MRNYVAPVFNRWVHGFKSDASHGLLAVGPGIE